MKLNPIHEMFDPGTHHICQQLSRNRIESCECTFCGEKAKLKDILLLHVSKYSQRCIRKGYYGPK